MAARGRLRVEWETAAVAAGMLLIGGVFAGFGGWYLWTTRAFIDNATPVVAVVIAENERCDDDGCTWWPELAFETPEGEPRQARTQFGSSDYDFREGSQVDVLYNPDYGYVRVPGFSNLWLFGAAFLFLGMFAVLPALWIMARLAIYREGGKG